MKKIIFGVLSLLVAAEVLAITPGLITIKGTKKKESSREGGRVRQGKNVATKQDDLYYVFDLSTLSKDTPPEVTVRWVVLVNTMMGRLRVASQGSEKVALSAAKPTQVETPIFTLNEEKGPRGAKFEAEVAGYAVRVTDAAGNLVGEKFDPESARKRLSDAFDGRVDGQ